MRQLRVQGTNRRNTITAEEAPIYYVREIITFNYRKTIPKIKVIKISFNLILISHVNSSVLNVVYV